MIINDFRNRRNLDGYFLAVGALIITILEMLGKVDESVISSAILAILVFISIWLIQNRHENSKVQNALSKIDIIQSLFGEVSSGLGTSVVFEVVQRGAYVPLYQALQRFISQAKREVLILDYFPLTSDSGDVVDPRDVVIEERQKYHNGLLEKVKSSQKGEFKYRRIVQLPEGRPVSDLFKDDEPFQKHCEGIIELGKNQEQNISLHKSPIIFHGTIMIVDRERLIVSIDITDPDDEKYIDPGFFQFYDPEQKITKQFVQYFERAYVKAHLVRQKDLS